MFSRKEIINRFDINPKKSSQIDLYLKELLFYNKHTNLVGKTTLINPWNSHILDSIQICSFIKNKHSSILDLGTGAGIPGLILAINDYTNISVVDSNTKKIKFIEFVTTKLNIHVNIYHKRIEQIMNQKFDYLISRALANLNILFFYSHKLIKKKSILIFLKGQLVNDEIDEAYKNWKFKYDQVKSLSDKRGVILIVRELGKING